MASLPRPERKQATLVRVRVKVVGGHREARRGDEQSIEIGAAKGAARRPRAGQFDDPLPRSWVNNAFDGWDRRARITRPEDRIAISLTASPALDVFILYSRSQDADFFCFEPVSHYVDAHHGEGLTPLEHVRR
ncbi:hypothetical protein [Mesorhizobium caraganae]|uniref:hypothetical protein n=1 Tax=Mesorhizobium caraganae TaxID=483206 RepID=UPI003DA03B81